MRVRCLSFGLLLVAQAAHGEVRTGTFRGNGIAGRTIVVGFQPAVVIVKGNDTDGVDDTLTSAVLRSETMVGDTSKPLKGDQPPAANLITSLVANGFTVGTDRMVNQNGIDYYWVVFSSSADLATGSYVGNGTAQSLTGTGFSPEYVILLASTNRRAVQRPASASDSFQFWAGSSFPDAVTSLDADGFTLGASNFANEPAVSYHFVAFNAVDGEMAVGAYVGSGTDNRSIPTPGFQPEYLLVRSASNTHDPVQRMRSQTGDASLNFRNNVQPDRIQRFETTGFQVGNDSRVNTSAETYFYVAFATNPISKNLTTTEAGPTVRVEASSYRAQFDATTGAGLRELYDLVEDPSATVDLAGGSTAGRVLHDDGIESGGVWYNVDNDANSSLEVLESTRARARVRQVARHADPGGAILRGPLTIADHTLYVSGKLAVDWTRWIQTKAGVTYTQNDRDLNLHLTAAAPLDAWSPFSQSGALGTGAGGADYLLAQIARSQASGAGARTDLLSIQSADWPQASTTAAFPMGGNEWLNLIWHDGTGGTLGAGTRSRWSFLDYLVPRDILNHQDPKVTERANAHRSPDVPTLNVGGGWFSPSESTAAPSDYYNEREAVYDFTFDTVNGLDVTFDATTPRFTPFFKIKQWRSWSNVPDVTLTAAELAWRASEQTGATTPLDDTTSDDETQRVVVRAPFLTRSGSEVRIRMRAHGGASLTVSGFSIAETDPLDDRDVVDATSTPITFGGTSSVTITPGASIWSDWMPFVVDERKSYSVTFYIDPVVTGTVEWFGSTTQKYILFGDQSGLMDWSTSAPGASTRIDSLEEIEVRESSVLASGSDFLAAVKPVTRSHFGDITWYSSMESAAAITSPNIGPPGTPVGVTAATGRYGGGVDVDLDGEYITLPASQVFNPNAGAVELWYRPSYDFGTGTVNDDDGIFGYWIDNQNYFYVFHEPYGGGPGTNDGINFDVRAGPTLSDVTTGGGPSFPVYWRANEWVHLRFTWDLGAGLLQSFVNGVLVASGAYLAAPPLPPDDILYFGDRNRNGNTSNNVRGTLDEVYFYDGAVVSPSLARGGLTAAADEYLASSTRNFPLAFTGADAVRSGEYWFVGADSQFGGLNVELATFGAGVSADAIEWEYWSNASGWKSLEVPGFFDETESFSKRGTVYWPELPDWDPYAVRAEPELYYVRAHLSNGESYTTTPVEQLVQTDVLLFQLCRTLVREEQRLQFAAPIPTAVELVSFEATGGNGHVVLDWRTGSEMLNLGFHLYRAEAANGPFARITETLIPGLGSSPEGAAYTFVDTEVTNGVDYLYLLEDIETTGRSERHGPVRATPSSSSAAAEITAKPITRITFGEPAGNRLIVTYHGAGGASVDLVIEGFVAEPLEDGTVRIVLPGLETLDDEVRTWVDAIAGRRVDLVSSRTAGVAAFAFQPSGTVQPDLVGLADGTVRLRMRNGRTRHRVTWESARIDSIAFQGSTKKALLSLSPLHWDETRGQLLLARRIQVRLSFRRPEHGETSAGAGGRLDPSRARRSARPGSFRLETAEAGLHVVSISELGIKRVPTSFRLSRLGLPVPYRLEGDRLYFWSEGGKSNPYGDENVYELELGEQGPQIPSVDGSPSSEPSVAFRARVEREEERLYNASLVDTDDRWFWDAIIAPARRGYSFAVSNSLSERPSTIEVGLFGGTDFPVHHDHHVRAYVNGALVGETMWGGRLPTLFRLEVPAGVVRDGDNTLELENVGDTGARYSLVYLDRFVVDYPRRPIVTNGRLEGSWEQSGRAHLEGVEGSSYVVDVSDGKFRWIEDSTQLPSGTLALDVEAGHRYSVVGESALLRPRVERVGAASLRAPRKKGADYLVVGPAELIIAAGPLLEHRRRQGLTVVAAPIEQVYDEFGYGERRPEAVRDFLTYAYHQWGAPSLRYVLLLGDATYDFKDRLGTGVENQVPPLMLRTRLLWTVSDPTYAAVNGDDLLPDISIGRLPASSVDALVVMIDKILAYEGASYPLSSRMVLVADNPDAAGDFEAETRDLAATTLAGKNVETILLGRLDAPAARARVRAAFNEGVSLMSYTGHGGIEIWASERLLDNDAVEHLARQPVQPIVLSVNCLNGYFHFPYFPALGEKLLEADGKGAVAVFAPSGMSYNEPARKLHRALVQELVSGGHRRLGDAVLAAQKAYTATSALPELLSIYHLLGDPALSLR